MKAFTLLWFPMNLMFSVVLGCVGTSGPSLTNDAGTTGCLLSGEGSSFTGVASDDYWSSSTIESIPYAAWFANLVDGVVNDVRAKVNSLRVWPVRGGPR